MFCPEIYELRKSGASQCQASALACFVIYWCYLSMFLTHDRFTEEEARGYTLEFSNKVGFFFRWALLRKKKEIKTTR